jgi:hypothetical protein
MEGEAIERSENLLTEKDLFRQVASNMTKAQIL